MKVNIKLIEGGKIPVKMHTNDAGFDCYAREFIKLGNQYKYNLGFAIEIPQGYVGLVFPRSSVCKTGLSMSNSVGVIDSNYRGEVSAVYNNVDTEKERYKVGERVCQLIIMPYPEIEFNEVEELADSDRGENGYGSTGK